MSDPLVVRPQSRVLAWVTVGGVALLAVGAFTLSFTALRELAAREFAIAPGLAFIYPLVVDGFIVIATAAAFALKKRGPRATWYPWATLAVFGALSVLGNAAHAMDNPSGSFPVWVGAVGASVPAVALLIASHLMVMMIGGKSTGRATARKGTAPLVAERSATAAAARVTPTGAVTAVEVPRLRVLEPESPSAPRSAAGASLVERVAEAVEAGIPVTAALIADIEGVSERTGRRRLADFRVQRPDLFGLDSSRAEAAR